MSRLSWPALPLAEWQDTYDTLHMWTQIVGKVALATTPPMRRWNGRGVVTTYDRAADLARWDRDALERRARR